MLAELVQDISDHLASLATEGGMLEGVQGFFVTDDPVNVPTQQDPAIYLRMTSLFPTYLNGRPGFRLEGEMEVCLWLTSMEGHGNAHKQLLDLISRDSGAKGLLAALQTPSGGYRTDAGVSFLIRPAAPGRVEGQNTEGGYTAMFTLPMLLETQVQTVIPLLPTPTPSPSGSSIVDNETPSGVIDGLNTIFVTANIPSGTSLQVFHNGIRQIPGVNFTHAGATITLAFAPLPGDNITVSYRRPT